MEDKIKVELAVEEWGQVMMVLQGGVYRVVAPLLNKISLQVQIATASPRLRPVDNDGERDGIPDPLSAAE